MFARRIFGRLINTFIKRFKSAISERSTALYRRLVRASAATFYKLFITYRVLYNFCNFCSLYSLFILIYYAFTFYYYF
jgi:hypothetical protein